MSDLNEEQKQKLLEMIESWERYHLAMRFLTGLGGALKWLVGLGAGAAVIWGALHGNTPR